MNSGTKALTILCLGLCFILNVYAIKLDFFDPDAVMARNLREKIKFHVIKANNAEKELLQSANDDDVDKYNKWLIRMRHHDWKMNKAIEDYKIRDELEARMYLGEIHIEGFEKKFVKGTAASIFDHFTFRSKY